MIDFEFSSDIRWNFGNILCLIMSLSVLWWCYEDDKLQEDSSVYFVCAFLTLKVKHYRRTLYSKAWKNNSIKFPFVYVLQSLKLFIVPSFLPLQTSNYFNIFFQICKIDLLISYWYPDWQKPNYIQSNAIS